MKKKKKNFFFLKKKKKKKKKEMSRKILTRRSRGRRPLGTADATPNPGLSEIFNDSDTPTNLPGPSVTDSPYGFSFDESQGRPGRRGSSSPFTTSSSSGSMDPFSYESPALPMFGTSPQTPSISSRGKSATSTTTTPSLTIPFLFPNKDDIHVYTINRGSLIAFKALKNNVDELKKTRQTLVYSYDLGEPGYISLFFRPQEYFEVSSIAEPNGLKELNDKLQQDQISDIITACCSCIIYPEKGFAVIDFISSLNAYSEKTFKAILDMLDLLEIPVVKVGVFFSTPEWESIINLLIQYGFGSPETITKSFDDWLSIPEPACCLKRLIKNPPKSLEFPTPTTLSLITHNPSISAHKQYNKYIYTACQKLKTNKNLKDNSSFMGCIFTEDQLRSIRDTIAGLGFNGLGLAFKTSTSKNAKKYGIELQIFEHEETTHLDVDKVDNFDGIIQPTGRQNDFLYVLWPSVNTIVNFLNQIRLGKRRKWCFIFTYLGVFLLEISPEYNLFLKFMPKECSKILENAIDAFLRAQQRIGSTDKQKSEEDNPLYTYQKASFDLYAGTLTHKDDLDNSFARFMAAVKNCTLKNVRYFISREDQKALEKSPICKDIINNEDFLFFYLQYEPYLEEIEDLAFIWKTPNK